MTSGLWRDELQPARDRAATAGATARLKRPAATPSLKLASAVSPAPENISDLSVMAPSHGPEATTGRYLRPASFKNMRFRPDTKYFSIERFVFFVRWAVG